MKKEALRKVYLQKRSELNDAAYSMLSRMLCDQFFVHVDVSFLKVIHCFLPLKTKREPDTWLMIERIRREFPHIRLVLPKVNGNNLEHYYFEGLHQLEINKWGIEEPKQGIPADVKKIDLVLVPLLCFDEQGNRVGYGKGFYDQFLSALPDTCQRLGISFWDEAEVIDDVKDFDIPLQAVLTPKGMITF
jgi:5-formyltetrahydrofolate cyclo-ligase